MHDKGLQIHGQRNPKADTCLLRRPSIVAKMCHTARSLQRKWRRPNTDSSIGPGMQKTTASKLPLRWLNLMSAGAFLGGEGSGIGWREGSPGSGGGAGNQQGLTLGQGENSSLPGGGVPAQS